MKHDHAAPELSYAAYFQEPLQRLLVRAVEKASGQPHLARLYQRYRCGELGETAFFEAAILSVSLTVW